MACVPTAAHQGLKTGVSPFLSLIGIVTQAPRRIRSQRKRDFIMPHPIRCLAVALIAVLVIATPVTAATEVMKSDVREDCRYRTDGYAVSKSQTSWNAFPDDDVFRPLLADPKQPQVFFRYQYVNLRDVGVKLNTANVAVGEYFGLIGRRQEKDCDGWQLGITGAVFAQFDLDANSYDLINADYNIGLPLSYRRGPLSFRIRPYHQSSHIGDEFLLDHPGFTRLNFSYEEVEALVSLEIPLRSKLVQEIRLYGGGAYMFDRQPRIHRARDQWGIEIRGGSSPNMFLTQVTQKKTKDEQVEHVRGLPFIGVDVKNFEQHRWNFETSVIAGMEFYRPSTHRRLRLYLTYYHGYNPYGQFFISEKIESFGAGLSLAF